ncbi:hypothetical protein VNO78_29124 [Psophocarpus tetragonolobus]|uniref:non-specific serine/threonine protein kinase n=1 Tax=Psophocarpus tetragonolobus TaxID=3891 RepID=A0AAN9X0L5_PSOTE
MLGASCIIVLLLLILTSFLSSINCLSFNITKFDDPTTSSDISYEGDGRATNGSVDLNKVSYLFRVGRAIYAKPLRLWDPSSSNLVTDFATRFAFTIERVNLTDTSYGDGFAFYIAPLGYRIPPNSGGGTFGLFNATTNSNLPENHVLAVEFDTFVGSTDPPMRHVGIDDNSLTSVAFANFDIDNNLGRMCHALITYTSSTQTLFVSWSFKGKAPTNTNNNNNTISYQIDLKKILPEWVNIGFSASTGLSTEKNTIFSWEFSSTLSSNGFGNAPAKGANSHTLVLIVAVVCPLFLLFVAATFAVMLLRKKRRRDDCMLYEVGDEELGPASVKFDLDKATIPRRFEYKELVDATNGFCDDRKLGQGASGQVYKGVLSYLGRVVAVKRISAEFENSERVFTNEVRIISRLIHKNLVQFIGWCHEENELLLVFEYMPNGSLDSHLFGNKRILEWNIRYKVALGVANALRYLHEDAEQCVLHRDIKSANVLLDTEFNTKVGDFGMAKLVDPRLRTQQTGVVGTYGYLAPEYVTGGRASRESDMYSFGVVALEIASGRRTYQDGEFHVSLMNWVWQLYVEDEILRAADEKLGNEFDVNEMKSLLVVGLWCTNPNDKERPKAGEVIKVLNLEAPLPMLPLDMYERAPPVQLIRMPHHHNNNNNHSLQSPPITNSLMSVGR